MRIWDVFLFNDELDVLECRLRELDGYGSIWRHVLVEAPAGHQGAAKPLHYAENRERFAAWSDRIVPVAAGPLPADPLAALAAQRDAAGAALAGADPGDVLLIADVDEIPSPSCIAACERAVYDVVGVAMRGCFFAVDLLWPVPVMTSVIAPAHRAGRSLARMRERGTLDAVKSEGGSHLSWLGGPAAVLSKLASYAQRGEVAAAVSAAASGGGLFTGNPLGQWAGGAALIPVDIDETWPRWVSERGCPPSWFRPRN